jgi:serine/threonine-protein kinase
MGEVYRATDTNLKRQVAIKVLPESVAGDAERLARFQREAEVLAQLNHPNIAQIHGLERADGHSALVMELVEGPTLADRIASAKSEVQSAKFGRGTGLPVDEALAIAKQVAEALEAAHEQGIIHRDLKPANIKVRPDGTVKVLDFGLAKALEPASAFGASAGQALSQAPTITTPAMTQAGIILGTAAYMSPEQARGKPVDKRTDIWAFGCVLYEMLTGRRAFEAEDVSLTLAEVMKSEPDWAALPAAVPPVLARFVRRCLHKDPKQRIPDIAAVRLALDGAFELSPTSPVAAAARPMRFWQRPVFAIVVPLLALAVGGLVARTLAPESERPVTRLSATTTTTAPFSPVNSVGGGGNLVVSPDGRRIVYRAVSNDTTQIYARPIDQLEGAALFTSLESVTNPAFSPDGAWIAFGSNADLTWKKVSTRGGPPVTLFSIPSSIPCGTSWGPSDTVVVALGGLGLWRGPAAGGTREILTTPDAANGEIAHCWPEFLPGGDAMLLTVVRGQGAENMDVAVLDLVTADVKVVLSGGSSARYSPTGHLVYGVDGTLYAVPFDVARREVTGDPVPILEGVMTGRDGAVEFSLSRTGALVYGRGDPQAGRSLVWIDRQGNEEPLGAPRRLYENPRLSPDGTRVAVGVLDEEQDIWTWDLSRRTLTRLTFDAASDSFPVWTPDGKQIVFASTRSSSDGQASPGRRLYRRAADGTGAVERLTEGPNSQYSSGFSPDGAILVLTENSPDSDWDLRVLRVRGEPTVETLVRTSFGEVNGDISPDGRWIAYQSDAAGEPQIYVRPFPNVDAGQWQISTESGIQPLWSRDGRELFYRTLARGLMAVEIQTEPTFAASTPQRLLDGGGYFLGAGAGRTYDVALDGQRFLMIRAVTAESVEVIIVENFAEELRRLVPTD